jgi:hypothetical protein
MHQLSSPEARPSVTSDVQDKTVLIRVHTLLNNPAFFYLINSLHGQIVTVVGRKVKDYQNGVSPNDMMHNFNIIG